MDLTAALPDDERQAAYELYLARPALRYAVEKLDPAVRKACPA
jgi:hypothetical protein